MIELSAADVARYEAKIDRAGPIVRAELGPCWAWTASVDEKGYGILTHEGRSPAGKRTRRGYRAHRIAWILANGDIPEGLNVCHHCDNPPCVNPTHLFLGSHADNNHDMRSKGREARLSGENHWTYRKPELVARKLTPEQVVEIRRARAAGVRVRELAEKYGVHEGSIYQRVKAPPIPPPPGCRWDGEKWVK